MVCSGPRSTLTTVARVDPSSRKRTSSLRLHVGAGRRYDRAPSGAQITRAQACDCPLNRLFPVEVLCEVFRCVVWSEPAADAQTRDRALTTLALVCLRWRDVLFGDAGMWGALWVDDPASLRTVRTRLERADTAPLDLHLRDSDSRPLSVTGPPRKYLDEESVWWLMGMMREQVAHLRTVDATLDRWDSVRVILASLHPIPNLQSLSLRYCGAPRPDLGTCQEAIVLGSDCLPALRHLVLDRVHIDWERSPLANLTTLELSFMDDAVCPSAHRFRSILSSSPHLRKLVLDGVTLQTTPDACHYVPVQLNELEILELGHFTRYDDAALVMSLLDAPNVHALALREMKADAMAAITGRTKAREMFTSVRALSLERVELDRPYLFFPWLRSMRDLVRLRLVDISTAMLLALTFFEDEVEEKVDVEEKEREKKTVAVDALAAAAPVRGAICPGLAVVEFFEVSSHLIAFVLDGRREAGVPLKMINVSGAWIKLF